MIPELGHFALILALVLSATLAFFSLVGAQKGVAIWIGLARPMALMLFFSVAVAFACLAVSRLSGPHLAIQGVPRESNWLAS